MMAFCQETYFELYTAASCQNIKTQDTVSAQPRNDFEQNTSQHTKDFSICWYFFGCATFLWKQNSQVSQFGRTKFPDAYNNYIVNWTVHKCVV